jgi:hypothetical protein
MLKKIFYALLLSTTIVNIAKAQDPVYKKYTWNASPKIQELTAQEKELNYIKLKQKVIFEYVYESSGELVMYETVHDIIHFNNEKGIEEMNKIYVSLSRVLEEMDLKARTITPAGKVITLNKSNVKKVDNLEDQGPFMIFAMEGIETGGEIEYIYTNKKSPNIYFSSKIQSDIIKKDINVDIYSPENLVFEAKGYNGLPEFVNDTTVEGKNHIYTSIALVEALNEEKYAFYETNKMRFDVQLTYNLGKSKTRLYSFESAGVDFYNTIFSFSKSEIKSVEKVIAKQNIEKLNTEEAKISALEVWVKSNIGFNEDAESNPVDKMLDVKYGNELSLEKFYVCAAQILKIPVEAVLTSNRTKRKFDPNFPNYNSFQEYLLYFPSIGKFISADNYSSRLGFPPASLTGNKGLFVKETIVGDLKTGVSKVKEINYTPVEFSYNNIDAKVSFAEGTLLPTINYIHSFMGYPAAYSQPAIPYMNDTQKEQFLDEMAKHPGKETVVKKVSMKGGESKDVLVNPLIIESIIETPQLIENAGNKILFKVGDLIGPQAELYQDKKRQLDGEILYAHSFGRKIEITIPSGYKIKNPETIKIDKKYTVNGKDVSVFVSNYTIQGNTLMIDVYEDYKVLVYPKDQIEQWKAVINAAADFNKVVLIFEKL